MTNFYLILNFNCKTRLIKVDQLEFEGTISFYSESCKIRKRKIIYREGEITIYCEIENFAGEWEVVGMFSTYMDSSDQAEKFIESVSV